MADEDFAALALRLRGRTRLTQRDLAARLNTHVRSIQLWEAGASHPSTPRLQALIEVLLDAGGFAQGEEPAEAEALWDAVMARSPRQKSPFDDAWFVERLRGRAAGHGAMATTRARIGEGRQQWGNAPDVAGFLGRTEERTLLGRWIVDDRCRMIAVLGPGGVGKTLLAARVAHDVAPLFEQVHWRSLRHALPFSAWLAGAIGFLSPEDDALARSVPSQLERLLELLQETRTLLILDNLEAVLQDGSFGELLRQLAETSHQSCLLLTSREEPTELEPIKGTTSPARTVTLAGLALDDGRALLERKGLVADAATWDRLISRYGGNPLVLQMVGASIGELFGGDVSAYLADIDAAQGSGVFGGVRDLLDGQVQRLSELEHELLRWLAVEGEPVTFVELATDIGPSVSRGAVREAVEALLHRSLLERRETGPSFTLQSVVLEYVAEQLIEDVADELARGEAARVLAQPLVRATAREYVRQSQERQLARPVIDRLVAGVGGRGAAERRLQEQLDGLRRRPFEEHGYGPGNLLNLLRLMRGHLQNVDASGLSIRQAYLAGIEAQDASFAGASIAESALPQSFHHTSVALSPDGAHILAGTSTGELCLWRASDRALLLAQAAHGGPILGVDLSAERTLAASASQDGVVKLWEASSGRHVAALEGHSASIHSVALSGDGSLVASASQDGTVKLWRAAEGELIGTLTSPAGLMLSVAVSSDKSFVVGGSLAGPIALWNTHTGRLIATLEGHAAAVTGVALSGGAELLASASHDGTVKLWDVRGRTLRATLTGHASGVWDVAVSQDGELVASGSQDGTVRVWSGQDGRLRKTLLGHTGGIWDVALSADGQYVAGACLDGSVLVWETNSGWLSTTLEGQPRAVWDVALSGDGRVAACGSQDATVSVWTTSDAASRTALRGHTAVVQGVALSYDGAVVASGSHDGTVRLWRLDTGHPPVTLSGHVGGVCDVALSADGQRIVSGGDDGAIMVWDAMSHVPVATLRGHAQAVRGVAIDDAYQVIVSGSDDGLLKLWDANTGQLLKTLEGHVGGVRSVSVDASGRLLASGGIDGTVKLWDAAQGVCLRTFSAHVGGVWDVALSRDGRLLTSCGFDQAVRIWDVSNGRLLGSLSGHGGPVSAAALNANAVQIASGSLDGTVRLWDVASGVCLRELRSDRSYERMDITGLTGVSPANQAALIALGAVDRS